MKTDPDHVQKRLGDGYYENQLIKDEVMKLTGRRFLDGYATDEEEYKALMDAGIAYAKENTNARIGIAPSEEEQKRLKKDMVWMVETSVVLPDGSIVKALVPQVYLAGGSKERNLTGPAVVSGENIDFHVANDILNTGTILAGKAASLSAENINNHGGTIAGSNIALQAVQNIRNTGTITAEKSASLYAGQDLENTAETRTQRNEAGETTNISQSGTIAVTGDNGALMMDAGRDVKLTASNVVNAGKNGMTEITVGRNLSMETAKTGYENTVTWDGSNRRYESESVDTGASITTKGNLTLKAGETVMTKAATGTSDGAVDISAGKNISITGGEDKVDLVEDHKHKSHGFLSSTTETTHDEVHRTGNIGSAISGKTVTMTSGQDMDIKGSTVVSDDNTILHAGGKINITSAEETDSEIHNRTVKKSGLLG